MASSKRSVTVFFAAMFLIGGALSQSREAASKRHRTRLAPSTFLETPQESRYIVTKKQPVNLTWVATDVCKLQIKCVQEKFIDENNKGCKKTCTEDIMKKRITKTRIFKVEDFHEGLKFITCRYKVCGTNVTRSGKIIVEKASQERTEEPSDAQESTDFHNAQEWTEEPSDAQERTEEPKNGSFPVWAVVIIVVVALLALLLAVYIIVKKRFSHFIQVDLNVREDIGEESTTERRGFIQESLPPPFDASAVLSRQLCNAEPLGAGATGENSSVRFQRGGLVINNNYNRVTTVNLNTQLNTVNTNMHTTNNYNVELEQNGRMTVEDIE
ncbi:hypothetical protein ABFA07_020152 [Porites harrisoni]